MHRRDALTLIALSSFIPSIAFGQERRPSAEGLGETAVKYLHDTLEVGGLSLAASRIALEKAENGWVKRFANYETAEQEGIANIFKTLGGHPPSETGEEHLRTVRDLSALSGERFEAAYLQAQAQGHERLLHIQDAFIATGQDPLLGDVAKLIRGRVEEHIDLIHTIRDEIHV
jgi:putative membrane protein